MIERRLQRNARGRNRRFGRRVAAKDIASAPDAHDAGFKHSGDSFAGLFTFVLTSMNSSVPAWGISSALRSAASLNVGASHASRASAGTITGMRS